MMEDTVSYKNIAKWEVFNSIEDLSAEFFRFLLKRLIESRKRKQKFSIALSGGTTPIHIYEYLSHTWNDFSILDNLLFFWGDERCVPPDNVESNFGNAHKTLFSRIPIPEKNIYRMMGEEEPFKESIRYAGVLKQLKEKNGFPVIDLIILGIGDDGHTASIFPGQGELLNTDKWVHPSIHPSSGQKRITLTGKVLNNAKEVLFLATGNKKQKVIHEIFHDLEQARNYPAWHIRPETGNIIWFMDTAASEILY